MSGTESRGRSGYPGGDFIAIAPPATTGGDDPQPGLRVRARRCASASASMRKRRSRMRRVSSVLWPLAHSTLCNPRARSSLYRGRLPDARRVGETRTQ